MVSSTVLQAWCSTIIEVSCSSPITVIIECKYSRVMMMMASRSCPSSASMAMSQASSVVHGELRSITSMVAYSLPITAVYWSHCLWATNRSCRALLSLGHEVSTSSAGKKLRSTSIIVASSSPIPTTIDWCSCRQSISRSCSRSAVTSKDLNLASSIIHQSLSIMIDIESLSPRLTTIECKYCRWSMARSCSSSAPKAINQVDSKSLVECALIIKVESSSPTPTTIGCKHSLPRATTSRPSIVVARCHGPLHSTSIEVSSRSRQAIECMWLEPINGLPTRSHGVHISINMLHHQSSKQCRRWRWFDRWSMSHRRCRWFRTSCCSRSSRSCDATGSSPLHSTFATRPSLLLVASVMLLYRYVLFILWRMVGWTALVSRSLSYDRLTDTILTWLRVIQRYHLPGYSKLFARRSLSLLARCCASSLRWHTRTAAVSAVFLIARRAFLAYCERGLCHLSGFRIDLRLLLGCWLRSDRRVEAEDANHVSVWASSVNEQLHAEALEERDGDVAWRRHELLVLLLKHKVGLFVGCRDVNHSFNAISAEATASQERQ